MPVARLELNTNMIAAFKSDIFDWTICYVARSLPNEVSDQNHMAFAGH
jgi:hypothetical protein